MNTQKKYLQLVLIFASALHLMACGKASTDAVFEDHLVANELCDATKIIEIDRERTLSLANSMLANKPVTVTAHIAERSAGGPNDFYSEGDYWWPVDGDPSAPYQRKDGQSNPNNFIQHRLSMMRLADHVASFASAYRLTKDAKYAKAANEHFHAWFASPLTRMNPSLLYAQAISGRHTGRSIGLIDTLHLVEVARAAKILIDENALEEQTTNALLNWFSTYANWMNTHPFGIKERDWHNNHAIAWSLQVASFADLVDNQELLDLVSKQFINIYLSEMMDVNGGFPKELARTKPYGYSIFVLDLMAGIATIASTPEVNLWEYRTSNGRSMELGINFLYPFIKDKTSWPYPKDIQYWDDWPVRQSFLLQGAIALQKCDLLTIAESLPAVSDVYEVKRNWPLRSPILWI